MLAALLACGFVLPPSRPSSASCLGWPRCSCPQSNVWAPGVVGAVTEGDEAGPVDSDAWNQIVSTTLALCEDIGLTLASLKFSQGKLLVLAGGGSIDDLQQLNGRLSRALDEMEAEESMQALPAYLLEVSSPGLSDTLQTEDDFAAFKGFEVVVTTSVEYKKKREFKGTLQTCDEADVRLNLHGRPIRIPRELVAEVRLPKAMTEPGDR